MIKMGMDNGILAKIRGDDISAGGKLLPPAGHRPPPDHLPTKEQPTKEDRALVLDRLPHCGGVPI